jgi:hypothetical protein
MRSLGYDPTCTWPTDARCPWEGVEASWNMCTSGLRTKPKSRRFWSWMQRNGTILRKSIVHGGLSGRWMFL